MCSGGILFSPYFVYLSGIFPPSVNAWLLIRIANLRLFRVGRLPFAADRTRTFLDLEVVFVPGFPATLHLHHRKALSGKLDSRGRRQMTDVRITIDDIQRVFPKSLERRPLFLGQIYCSRNVSFRVILRSPDIDNGDVGAISITV